MKYETGKQSLDALFERQKALVCTVVNNGEWQLPISSNDVESMIYSHFKGHYSALVRRISMYDAEQATDAYIASRYDMAIAKLGWLANTLVADALANRSLQVLSGQDMSAEDESHDAKIIYYDFGNRQVQDAEPYQEVKTA